MKKIAVIFLSLFLLFSLASANKSLFDGFEDGDTKEWSGSITAVNQSNPNYDNQEVEVWNGTYMGEVDNSPADAWRNITFKTNSRTNFSTYGALLDGNNDAFEIGLNKDSFSGDPENVPFVEVEIAQENPNSCVVADGNDDANLYEFGTSADLNDWYKMEVILNETHVTCRVTENDTGTVESVTRELNLIDSANFTQIHVNPYSTYPYLDDIRVSTNSNETTNDTEDTDSTNSLGNKFGSTIADVFSGFIGGFFDGLESGISDKNKTFVAVVVSVTLGIIAGFMTSSGTMGVGATVLGVLSFTTKGWIPSWVGFVFVVITAGIIALLGSKAGGG